jgi:hypothetical protein
MVVPFVGLAYPDGEPSEPFATPTEPQRVEAESAEIGIWIDWERSFR